ncbi:MAG: tetratricopeptide repeat protein [Bacteroidia bacterium]|nr:tetratricopeptide repeat protein [Bacteroidia bacterium]
MERIKSIVIKISLVLTALIAVESITFGQRISEEELQIETLYIEATNARLLGDNEKAISLYKKILEEDDTKHVVYYELSKVYLVAKLNKEALDAIQQAVRINPSDIWYQEELAAAHAANEDFVAASKVYEGLVSRMPKEQKFYFDLAFFYVKNNSIKKAISTLDDHESVFGVSEEVIGRKFNLYKTIDNVSKAEQELIKLVKAFPNQISYATGLAKFYEDTNNLSKAKSTYKDILKRFPDHTTSAVALARLESGKKSDKDLVSEIWADNTVNIDIKISKLIPAIQGLESAPDEKRTQLIEIGKTLVETHPKEAKAFSVYGDILHFSDRDELAADAYESALRLEKNIFSVWDQLNRIYLNNYQIKDLLDNTEDALDFFPNEPNIYYLNGYAANEYGDYARALNSLIQADIMTTSLPSLNKRVKAEIAMAYMGLGKKDQSETIINDLLKDKIIDFDILNRIAWISAFESGNLVRAQQLVDQIESSNENVWQVLLTAGLIEYRSQNFEKAKTKLGKCSSLAPESAYHVAELLGDTEYQMGNIEAAVQYWKDSKNLGNPSKSLNKKIASRQI